MSGNKKGLDITHKELTKEWNHNKNTHISPNDVTYGSHRKVWWVCKNEHEWESTVKNRAMQKSGCPICKKRKTKVIDHEERNKRLALEWHPTKNNDKAFSDFKPFSNKKTWWKCAKGHEWEAVLGSRSKGADCPYCSNLRVCEDNCLSTVNPKLATEWHNKKNESLTPYDVMEKSMKVVWWLCKEGHEWEGSIHNRNKGAGCPYCSKRLPTKETSIVTTNPELMEQWDYVKNQHLDPYQLRSTSHKKAWWKCEKGHNWEAKIIHVCNGQRCLECHSSHVNQENQLDLIYPELVKEWDYEKNLKDPNYYSYGMTDTVWWKCEQGHEWKTRIANRTIKNTKCPTCSKLDVEHSKALASRLPELVKEWHVQKNGELTPENMSYSSNQSVWWKCQNGHEWEATLTSRHKNNKPISCPYCTRKRPSEEYNFAILHPNLLQTWNYERNLDLNPYQLLPHSHKNVWWKCEKAHEWTSTIDNRVRGNGCPYCGGLLATKERNLAILFPDVLEEWDHNKNKGMNPEEIMPFSDRKVWWKCEKKHEWETSIANRTTGKGCPKCSSDSRTSFPEQVIFHCFKQVFADTQNRYHLKGDQGNGYEYDVFIPSLRLAIEYDGLFYHSKKSQVIRDEKKNRYAKDNHFTLIRVRNTGLPAINMHGFSYIEHSYPDLNSLKDCILFLADYILSTYDLMTEERRNLEKIRLMDIEKERTTILTSYKQYKKQSSVAYLYPDLEDEWHPTKNGELKLDVFTKGSHFRAWWKCRKGHEWEAAIYQRVDGRGCPYCSNKKVCEDNSLQMLYPQIAEEWHPSKNEELQLQEFTFSSTKKVWWKCKKGHEWETRIHLRTKRGFGCPYCSNQKVSIENSIVYTHPSLAKEFHPTNNGELGPETITYGMGKKLWWRCVNGHEWLASPNMRTHFNLNCQLCKEK
ncbi:hypothetical protein JCM9140_4590 [Halalkalibacter wakoensis JCM 9140]|uniref:Treble clef zinc finger domain-containing protein n=1 Tax=Halalkalibacter wakoensis JCM 9140 TaxID=1236970 RepID=W4Q8Q8_9BACI|nr:zinc-ribbon domain-containing protein [Halalkalibacter wakoensis]GAE28370.1 hypothetical protein JCM9140_4590 [Halalkalibacter wakoensis JCM 9140]